MIAKDKHPETKETSRRPLRRVRPLGLGRILLGSRSLDTEGVAAQDP